MKIAGRERCIQCMSLVESGEKCPGCGYDERDYESGSNQLSPGNCLHERYFLGKAIGEGGFGITYIAWDVVLAIPVAIKEYFPGGLGMRDVTVQKNNMEIHVYEGDKGREFKKGLHNFLKEARRLSQFLNLEGIVSVRDFFEENNTAYIVMEYIDGVCISDYIHSHGRMPAEEVLRMMKPVISSLQEIHRAHLIHRDISADNLMLARDGKLRLLDFGAARSTEISYETMTISIKRGFSPEEQYRANGDQNVWTDLYSLCATMYFMLTAVVPEESVERMITDRVVPLADMPEIDLSQEKKEAIDRGMRVFAKDRFPDISDLYQILYPEEEQKTVGIPYPSPVRERGAEEQMSRTAVRRELNGLLEERSYAMGRQRKRLVRIGAALVISAALVFFFCRFFLPSAGTPAATRGITSTPGLTATSGSIIPPGSIAAPGDTTTSGGTSTPGVTPDDKRVRVPDVTGMTWKDAKRTLRQSRLQAKQMAKEHRTKKGIVYRQKPKAGEREKMGKVIAVYVSKGQAPRATPISKPAPSPETAEREPGAVRTPRPKKKDYSAVIDKYIN